MSAESREQQKKLAADLAAQGSTDVDLEEPPREVRTMGYNRSQSPLVGFVQGKITLPLERLRRDIFVEFVNLTTAGWASRR
jgi:hypothetical protein